jgi:hypothetical protein
MSDNATLKEMKTQRAVLITKLTKFTKFINDIENREKTTEINIRLARIESLLNEYEILTYKIEENVSLVNGVRRIRKIVL